MQFYMLQQTRKSCKLFAIMITNSTRPYIQIQKLNHSGFAPDKDNPRIYLSDTVILPLLASCNCPHFPELIYRKTNTELYTQMITINNKNYFQI